MQRKVGYLDGVLVVGGDSKGDGRQRRRHSSQHLMVHVEWKEMRPDITAMIVAPSDDIDHVCGLNATAEEDPVVFLEQSVSWWLMFGNDRLTLSLMCQIKVSAFD